LLGVSRDYPSGKVTDPVEWEEVGGSGGGGEKDDAPGQLPFRAAEFVDIKPIGRCLSFMLLWSEGGGLCWLEVLFDAGQGRLLTPGGVEQHIAGRLGLTNPIHKQNTLSTILFSKGTTRANKSHKPRNGLDPRLRATGRAAGRDEGGGGTRRGQRELKERS